MFQRTRSRRCRKSRAIAARRAMAATVAAVHPMVPAVAGATTWNWWTSYRRSVESQIQLVRRLEERRAGPERHCQH